MKIIFAGGVGEHGRNCFLLQHEHINILLDCGLKKGPIVEYPVLASDQIKALDFIFITHSHADHSGAIAWIQNRGCKAKLVMTSMTKQQIEYTGDGIYLDTNKGNMELSPYLSFSWGRSGHCDGSVWYRLTIGNSNILYSGDYQEHSLAYTCDTIRNQFADVAILDCAYGNRPLRIEESIQRLKKVVATNQFEGQRTLFPVPKFGRGKDLELLFNKNSWVSYIKNPQLKGGLPPAFADCRVVFTGSVERGSFAEQAVLDGTAQLIYYPVHMTLDDVQLLRSLNNFKHTVVFHSGLAFFEDADLNGALIPSLGDQFEVEPTFDL